MTKRLNDEDLKKVTGGVIDDSTIKSLIGYDWSELETILAPFITFAINNGYETEAKTIKDIVDNKNINFMKLSYYSTAVSKLYPFAKDNNFTEVANVLSSIGSLLGIKF